jgi:hypothetical protein
MGNSRITYANVTATLALAVALGGTSYAAVQLPKNSVSAKQIKTDAVRTQEVKDGSVGSPDIGDGAVTGTDIADGAVAGADIANGSVGTADLSQTTLSELRGPRAYGVFTSAGQLVASRSRNVTVAKVPQSTGFYCVTPTPASGIDPTRTTIVATPDFDDGVGFNHSVMVKGATNSDASGCPGGFGLLTTNFDDSLNENSSVDMAVSFVIP